MSYREAAIEVLRTERRPMTAKEIVAAATARGLLASSGRTPDASLAGRLYTDIQRNGKESLFIQVGPRKYALREWSEQFANPDKTKSVLKEQLLKVRLDRLCEKFYNSIMSLPEDSRPLFTRDLIAGLRLAGANVTNNLLLLGVHSGRAESASASDIALLLRYYRINQPAIFDVAVSIMEGFPELTLALSESENDPNQSQARGGRARFINSLLREEKI